MHRIICTIPNDTHVDLSDYTDKTLTHDDIANVWSVHDIKMILDNAPFNPYTGEKVTGLEMAYLEHRKGVFIEDYMHDWNIKNNQFHIFSRTKKPNTPITIIIELNN